MQKIEDIINEASKCLNCKNPLCKKGCPIETNIPEFINEIKNNNLLRAYEILKENNIMSDICSNVCPYEIACVGHCVKGIKEEPVKISELEKYVNCWARDNKINYKYKKEKDNEIKIAIIGSGPAGISCAVELAKGGFNVTIFEKENKIGGLLTYGIPGFRLPRQITEKLTEEIINLKINVKTEVQFGKDITLESLNKDGYRAIFIGLGAENSSMYSLTDKECKSIYKSDFLLRKYNNKEKIKSLGNAVIIGGGNVAIDSARAALRMGAKTATIIYRRSKSEMTAREVELKEALENGVDVIYNAKVIDAIVEQEKIKNIRCIKTITKDGNLIDIKDTEFLLKADSVVFAIGLKPNEKLLIETGFQLEKGLIQIDENYMTNIIGVFAGGDATQNKSTVCNAIKDGKKAADSIKKFTI